MAQSARPFSSPVFAGKLLFICIAFVLSALTSTAHYDTAHYYMTSSATDYLALLSFKYGISHDPMGALASWDNDSIHFCQWHGVSCGMRGQRRDRVVGLDLESVRLVGSISPTLANLTFLRRLHIANNQLNSAIPRELGGLSELRYLNLSSNSLHSGIPPELGSLANLVVLDLGYNFLTGPPPATLGGLKQLQLLGLGANHLSGAIPPSFGNLSSLNVMALYDNSLTGTIPPTLGNLKMMYRLVLSNNILSGEIPPSFANLSSLVNLRLENNSLTGAIPPSIGNISSLELFFLSNNHLSGQVPPLGKLSSLLYLFLDRNEFTGSITDAAVGNLSSLILINLTFNNLTGVVPSSLWRISSLQSVQMGGNSLSGTLPTDMGNALPNLQILVLDQNQFHGPIPISLSNASSLEDVGLSSNKFSGSVPYNIGSLQSLGVLNLGNNQLGHGAATDWRFLSSLTNCSGLQVLSLFRNKLGGILPTSISNLSTTLEILYMYENNISGSLPENVGNLTGLTELHLGKNCLTGIVPASIGRLQMLGRLVLESNRFYGEIPSSFSNLTRLYELYLGYNILGGQIPRELAKCNSLYVLGLEHNSLTGLIPTGIFAIPSLSRGMYLGGNSLSGPLPSQVGDAKNVDELDFNDNEFSGEIPSLLGECQMLGHLEMQGNSFRGPIPSSLSQLKGLAYLDLSRNNLSGGIPKFLTSLPSLYYLNLSFNNFEGEVPKDGIFRNASAFSVLGNENLCGGPPELKLRPCYQKGSAKKHTIVVVISICSGVLCLILLLLGLYVMRLKRHNKEISPTTCIVAQHIMVSYAQLFHATDDFSSANLIGAGGFGSVYKGILDYNHQNIVVAVKVLNLQQRGAAKSFDAECKALRSLRHRNLVRVLTSCSSIDSRGHEFKALVFEFLPNGSLDSWLHLQSGELAEQRKLSCIQRINIAIDVASALDYLHLHGPSPVVHCDLKPSNILLDTDMVAHVGDFGLARFIHPIADRSGEMLSNSANSSVFKGSIGYVAPEYGLANIISTHGDIYSFGILLLEMFTGRRPTDDRLSAHLSLHRYVDMAIPEQVADIMDPNLLSECEYTETSPEFPNASIIRARSLKCIASILQMGISCSRELPMERMTIGDVISELHAVRDEFQEART